jgi:hypothetical protein
MSKIHQTVFAIALAAACMGASAQTDSEPAKHHWKDMHSAEVTDKQAARKFKHIEQMGNMDGQIKTMYELHEQMANAKTSQQRNVLMPKHMQAMRQGMALQHSMDAMKGEKQFPLGSKEREQMMEKRMDMMEMMMQMSMDRMAQPTH